MPSALAAVTVDSGKITADGKAIPKACTTCSNFVPEGEARRRYGRSTGAPMCAAFDKPLGRKPYITKPEDFEYVARKIGSKCPKYDAPANDRAERTFKVAFPALDLRERAEASGGTGDDRVTTCFACKHFAPSEVVMREWGWATGACSIKGELVPEQNSTWVGRNCSVSEHGPNRESMLGVTLFPEQDEDFLTPDLIGNFLSGSSSMADPSEYPTDKPVTEKQKAGGILAWRKLTDQERPDHDTGVFLPIYDTSRFPETLRSMVPSTGDDEHPEDYLDHNNAVYKLGVFWTELDETPALWGPAGVGKTEIFRHLAWLMQLPFYRFSITASTELDDLAGKMHYEAGRGTYFEYGRLPKAWQSPGVICLDEPNVGQPDVWQFIRPLTDNSKQLVLDMNEGERIDRNVDAYMGMAMNPAWDPRNVGAAVIGDADASRLMHVFMDLPPESVEEQIILTRCAHDDYAITRRLLKTIMAIAKELRGMCDQGTLPMSWGIRPNIKVARATRWFSLRDAYKIAAGDFLEPSQAEIIADIVNSHVA